MDVINETIEKVPQSKSKDYQKEYNKIYYLNKYNNDLIYREKHNKYSLNYYYNNKLLQQEQNAYLKILIMRLINYLNVNIIKLT